MEIRCEHCGEAITVDDATCVGQKIKCPYCEQKFLYNPQENDKTISEADLAKALAACRADPDNDDLYSRAPEGARMFIVLEFYGIYFKDRVNVDNYLAAYAEVESHLTKVDLEYLIRNETNLELCNYFQDLAFRKGFGELTTDNTKTKKIQIHHPENKNQPAPNPFVLRHYQKSTEPLPGKAKSSNHGLQYVLLSIAAIAIICGIIVLQKSGTDERAQAKPAQVQANDNSAREKLCAYIDELTEKLRARQGISKDTINKIRADRKNFEAKLEQMIENGNIRAAEAQSAKIVRLSRAETAVAVLKSSHFIGMASRYMDEMPFTSANICREKVREALSGKETITKFEIESIDQIAVAYEESRIGELRRSMGEKDDLMVKLYKDLTELVSKLQREKYAVYNLSSEGVQDKHEEMVTLAQSKIFTDELELAAINNDMGQSSTASDEFKLPPLAEENESAAPATNSMPVNAPPEIKSDEDVDNNPPEAQDVIPQVINEQPPAKPEVKKPESKVTEQKPKARRYKCKSPTKCMNFAESGHNFCPDHECHSYGCKEHVRMVSSPNWAHGGRSLAFMSTEIRNRIQHKSLGKYCSKHCCTRVCPEIKDYHGWWEDYLFWDNLKTVSFFHCDNERLANSRFCEEHACKVPTCASCRYEYWQNDNGNNSNSAVAIISPWRWVDWVLMAGPMCRSHSNTDPEMVKPRDTRTIGDIARERKEKMR